MLSVGKPSGLRLWGFVLTAAGGGALAFGAISDWAAVSIGGSVDNAIPTKGIDVWQGWAALALGAAIVVGILVLRLVPPPFRPAIAAAIVVMGLAAIGIAVWCLTSLGSVVTDSGVDALVRMVVEQLGLPEGQARQLVSQALGTAGVEVQAQVGLWVTLAGAIVATVGGVIDVAWVRRKRLRGDAIDPDTPA
jgi:hypothetical protein